MANLTDRLTWNVPIVQSDGTPTPEFMRFMQMNNIVINGNVPTSRKILAGSHLVGGGDLTVDRTISLGPIDLTTLADVDITTIPPTDGQVLSYVAADDKWEPATPTGGGGGSSLIAYVIDTSGTTVVPSFAGSWGNWPGMSITHTFVEGYYALNFSAQGVRSGTSRIGFSVDGVQIYPGVTPFVSHFSLLSNNDGGVMGNCQWPFKLTAGSHTIQILSSDAGSASTTAVDNAMMTVQLLAAITPIPPGSVTIRGSNITTSLSSATLVVPLPSGSAAGDFCVIFIGGHNAWTGAPSGWTAVDTQTGSFYNGFIVSKLLTSGDIGTGSVTFGFGGGPEDQVAVAVTFIGATGGIGTFVSQRNSSGSASRSLSTTVASATTDLVLCFGTNRDNSTDTVSIGTILQQSSASTASAVMTTSAALAGIQSATFNYSAFGSGDYQTILTVTPLPANTLVDIVNTTTTAVSTEKTSGAAGTFDARSASTSPVTTLTYTAHRNGGSTFDAGGGFVDASNRTGSGFAGINYWLYQQDTGAIYLYNSGAATALSGAWVDGDTFSLSLNTSTGLLTVKHNGTSIYTVTIPIVPYYAVFEIASTLSLFDGITYV